MWWSCWRFSSNIETYSWLGIKWLKNYTALYADHGLIFFDEDSGDVTFCCNEMGILSVNLNNINLDNNFDEDEPDNIILIRLFA